MYSFISITIMIIVLVLMVYVIIKKTDLDYKSSCTGNCNQGRNCDCELAEDTNDIQQDQRT